MRMGVAKVAKAIGVPATQWPGRCMEIATAIVEAGCFPGGTAVYGHWTGPVKPGTLFDGKPIIHHGWIQGPDNTVIDPTRFVFEGARPYVYFGENDYYDEGGDVFRQLTLKPPPAFNEKEPTFDITVSLLCGKAWDHVAKLLGTQDPTLCKSQLFWLANVPYAQLQPYAKEIYKLFNKLGHRCWVPIDNWQRVMREG